MDFPGDVVVGGAPTRSSAVRATLGERLARPPVRGLRGREAAVLELRFPSLGDLARSEGRLAAELVLDTIVQRLLRAGVEVVRVDQGIHELVVVADGEDADEVGDLIDRVLVEPVSVAGHHVDPHAVVQTSAVPAGVSWRSVLADTGTHRVERRAVRSARLYVRDRGDARREIDLAGRWFAEVVVVAVNDDDAADQLEADNVVALPTLVIDRRGMPTRRLVGDFDEARLRDELI